MKQFFSSLKAKITGPSYEDVDKDEREYVELDHENTESRQKIVVRPYQLDDFEDVKPILDALREGYTIALVNIKSLKEKDLIELKRAINKLKKTTDAIEGEIAGFGEDYIVLTPAFATIHKTKHTETIKEG